MSEEIVKTPQEVEEEGGSFFDLRAIIDVLILNWQWFALSLIICLGLPGYICGTPLLIIMPLPRCSSRPIAPPVCDPPPP